MEFSSTLQNEFLAVQVLTALKRDPERTYYLANVKIVLMKCKFSQELALGQRLDGPGSIPCVRGVEIFLHTFMSRLVLGSTQPPIK